MSAFRTALLATLTAASTLFASGAMAAPLAGSTATIAADLGVSFDVGDGACKSGSVVRAVGAGLELMAGDYTGSCRGLVTLDIADAGFTVTGLRESGVGDYRWLTLEMDFTGAGPITGVTLLSQTLFQAGLDNPTPSISFDADSITLSWDATASSSTIFELAQDGSAVFAVTTGGVVPTPATLALVGLGLVATGFARRKTVR